MENLIVIIIIAAVIAFYIIKIKKKVKKSSHSVKSLLRTEYEKAKKNVGKRVFVLAFKVSIKNPLDKVAIKNKLYSLKKENGEDYKESSADTQYHGIKKIFELKLEKNMLNETRSSKSKKVSLWIKLLARYYLWHYKTKFD